MSKNVELNLNLDYKESFSLNSDEENSQNYLDSETEIQKKDRLSLENALKSNNYEHAFEKINSKITSFCSKIQTLQDYSLCLGSKLDNKQKSEDIEKIILETGDEISETFNLIEIIKNFEYKDRNTKIQNIKLANNLEDKCNTYNEKFNNLVNEIKKQNLNLINQVRNSIRYSNLSDFSYDLNFDNISPKKNSLSNNNEKKYLDKIEMKRKQNNAIHKATKKIERSLSRRFTSNKLINNDDNDNNDKDKDNSLENINIDNTNNSKKNSETLNIQSNNNSSSFLTKKSSTIFHDMEKKVFIALEGEQQSFIRKYWLIILIIILILILIYYILVYQKKN